MPDSMIFIIQVINLILREEGPMERTTLVYKIEEKMHEILKRVSKQNQRTQSATIRFLLQKYLNSQNKSEAPVIQ